MEIYQTSYLPMQIAPDVERGEEESKHEEREDNQIGRVPVPGETHKCLNRVSDFLCACMIIVTCVYAYRAIVGHL